MMSQPSIALVQRGGRCSPWSDKISTVQNLSDKYTLKVSGIVIYDNNYYNDSTFIQESTEDVSYPKWTSALPDYRNIRYMTDNTIDTGSTFVAVYFVPRNYIDYINSTLIQKTLTMNGTRQMYTQLTFSLGENNFPSSSDPSASTGYSTTNTDQDNENAWDLERDKRNYIIYSVTAAVIVILVFVITRWCRAFARSRVLQDIETGAGQGNLLMQEGKGDVIPFDQLQHLGPIEKYGEASMLNSTCAICLDDFESDYYVRVLPCHHGYCTACIGKPSTPLCQRLSNHSPYYLDVWLTKKSSNCPICKYNCRTALQEKGLLVVDETEANPTGGSPAPTSTAPEVHIEMEPTPHPSQRDNPATANNNNAN